MLWSDGQLSVANLCYEVMVSEVLYIYAMKWWSVKFCTSMYEVMVSEVLCIYVMVWNIVGEVLYI